LAGLTWFGEMLFDIHVASFAATAKTLAINARLEQSLAGRRYMWEAI
jgi:hypothetical protein